jgi:hypothetical protein
MTGLAPFLADLDDAHDASVPDNRRLSLLVQPQRWDTRLLTFHAPHQRPPDLQAKAVNPKESRKAVLYWRCEHPG